MKFTGSVLLLFIAGITASPLATRGGKCPKNEVWSDCGSACPEYCGQPPDTMCIAMCQSGCFCKSGYIRSKANGGTCIRPSQCPK
ncbi:hypothetical protein EDB81DRAFT_787431 [Dactylonectria macrodidyma]|uniref:TIL domain-containing protein n=1 Tax=Dactylonectria macrodidyma TaxID=307937 RepID=A0A9P9F9Y2_9HYPO|nr:hypothetical protein EDB81DRAFT_787431 [Dactylonectria macrodidyma]